MTIAALELPPGLGAVQRTQLDRLVRDLRRVVEADVAGTAEGRFGFRADGTIEPADALVLTAAEQADRGDLQQVLSHLVTLGETSSAAVARLVREATFTAVNRLLAIRIAEAIGVLPESLARGQASAGFAEVKEVAPLVADDYAGYLRLCSDELAADAPALFDPRNPVLALAPSAGCLDAAVDLIGAADDALWTAADTLGWAYQFFNRKEERDVMRESSAPRTSRELAVRNQFFTPRYVVDFLVQNSLGRRLIEANPASPLLADLPLLLDPPSEQGKPLNLRDVRVLDPACGSGHFLLGTYDLLERAWHHAGVGPADAAPHIVSSLCGVDIDPRCAQVAAAAVALRARRRTAHGKLPRPMIVCARGLPSGASHLVPGLDTDQRETLDAVEHALRQAPLLGVLLRAERSVAAALGDVRAGQQSLGGDPEGVQRREEHLRHAVRELADAVAASPADRLLAAEVDDALRLWEVCRTRFTAVLMNPPFGEPVPASKPYLAAAYPTAPGREVLCAFVERGLELCRPDGYLGAITSRGPLFLKTGETWRKQVLLDHRLTAFADLGFGVMEQAMVEAAAYVVGGGRAQVDHSATFVRLLKDDDRVAALTAAVEATRTGGTDHRIYRVAIADLAAVPGSPLAYWMSRSLRRLFTDLPSLEGHAAEVRQGLATGDDFRFVRLFWEVDPHRVAQSAAETRRGKRWVPFAKGGEYSPYWSDIHLVLDWEDEGKRLREYAGSVIRNPQYYFRAGITWPLRTQGGFNPRLLPSGCVFGHKGPAIIPLDGIRPEDVLAWLLSRPARAVLAASATFGAYEVGTVQRIPWLNLPEAAGAREVVEAIIAVRRMRATSEESSRFFVAPFNRGTVATAAVAARDNELRAAVDALSELARFDKVLSENLALTRDDLLYLDAEVGRLPATDRGSAEATSEVTDVRRAWESQASPGGQWLVHGRLESVALTLNIPVADVATAVEGSAPSDESKVIHATDRISYLMGAAFGRWDLRVGRDFRRATQPADPVEPVPIIPPGMLLGTDRLAAAESPPDYPIRLPSGGILVDEPGHPADVEAAIRAAAAALWDDQADEQLADMVRTLGQSSLRDTLRRWFWKEHLSRYSKSRRQAPIYWPLTTASRGWGVWLYVPALARETLFAVAAEAGRRERLGGDLVERLAVETPSTGRSVRQIGKELEAERRLLAELDDFRHEADRLAALGWEPDLEDGFVLCAAPLFRLLPQWKDAAEKRKELRAGKYGWASVAAWKDHL